MFGKEGGGLSVIKKEEVQERQEGGTKGFVFLNGWLLG